jgi:hypothetical protein
MNIKDVILIKGEPGVSIRVNKDYTITKIKAGMNMPDHITDEQQINEDFWAEQNAKMEEYCAQRYEESRIKEEDK